MIAALNGGAVVTNAEITEQSHEYLELMEAAASHVRDHCYT